MAKLLNMSLAIEIIKAIKENEGPLTIKYLSKNIEFYGNKGVDIDTIKSVVNFGIENEIFEIFPFNYVGMTDKGKNQSLQIGEYEYYETVENSLRNLWSKYEYKDHQFIIEKTASTDSKIAGPWTRPDFTIISNRKFSYIPKSDFEIVTFEVKRPDSANVLSVFEALSHLNVATKSYVVFPINEHEWLKNSEKQAIRVKEECSRHGIGLILIENPVTNPAPRALVTPIKREIDPQKSSDFINAVLSKQSLATISTWL
jgi:hypothetical protein